MNSSRIATNVFILCAGYKIFFGKPDTQKTHLPIGFETMTGRIFRQSCDRNVLPYIVSWWLSLKDEYPYAMHFKPKRRKTICQTVLQTIDLWDDRGIFLLGDVIYSRDTMNRIFDDRSDFAMFGNSQDIFAFAFSYVVKEGIIEALEQAHNHAEGELRQFYRAYCGFDVDGTDRPGVPPESEIFRYVYDWTRDIDNVNEYRQAKREIVKAHLLDDLESLYES